VAWSWVWVLSPLWIAASLTAVVLVMIGVALGVAWLYRR
jgi:hypothetical protein